MGKRLERFDVGIVDETNGFRLDFGKTTEYRGALKFDYIRLHDTTMTITEERQCLAGMDRIFPARMNRQIESI